MNATNGTTISDHTVMECSAVTAAISADTMRHPGSGMVLNSANRGRSRRRSKRIQSGPMKSSMAPQPKLTPRKTSPARSEADRVAMASAARLTVKMMSCERHAPPRRAAATFFHAIAISGRPVSASEGTRANFPVRERERPICDVRNRCSRSARCCVASRAASSKAWSRRTTQR